MPAPRVWVCEREPVRTGVMCRRGRPRVRRHASLRAACRSGRNAARAPLTPNVTTIPLTAP
eukprot:6194988-Pleurochrysis_carterae.AAC.2